MNEDMAIGVMYAYYKHKLETENSPMMIQYYKGKFEAIKHYLEHIFQKEDIKLWHYVKVLKEAGFELPEGVD